MGFNIELSGNEHDEVEVDDRPSNNELIEESKVGISFPSEEEVQTYYMNYAEQKGWGCVEGILDKMMMKRFNGLHWYMFNKAQ